MELRCDHEAKTDTIICNCGHQTEAEASVWEAKLSWANHILAPATESAQAEEERYFAPEGDKRCGVAKQACTCLLPKGHEGDHRCVHGYWMNPAAPQPEDTDPALNMPSPEFRRRLIRGFDSEPSESLPASAWGEGATYLDTTSSVPYPEPTMEPSESLPGRAEER